MTTSDTATPLFITQGPDWGDKVTLTLTYATAINRMRAGNEQRTRQRFSGRPRIEYKNNGLTKEQWDERRGQIRAEMRTVCIVPFWTEAIQGQLSARPCGRRTGTASHRLAALGGIRRRVGFFIYELAVSAPAEWFTAGDWVYVHDGQAGQFRTIHSVGDVLTGRRAADSATLRGAASRRHRKTHAGAFLLILDPPAAGQAALGESVTFYPCLPCLRVSAQEEGRRAGQHSFSETIVYEAL